MIEQLEGLTIQSESMKACFAEPATHGWVFCATFAVIRTFFILTTEFKRSLHCLTSGLLTVYAATTYPLLRMSTKSHKLLQL